MIKVTVAKPTNDKENQLFEEKVHLQDSTGRKMTQKQTMKTMGKNDTLFLT